MALANPTLLDTTTSAVAVVTLDSGNFSPTASALLICICCTADTDQDFTLVQTPSDSFAGTGAWTSYTDLLNTDDGALDAVRVAIHVAQLGGAPGAGEVTVDIGGGDDPGRWVMYCLEVTGYDTVTPIEQSASNIDVSVSTGDITVTLGVAPAASSMVLAGFYGQVSDPVTHDPSYTELAETNVGAGGGEFTAEAEYDNGGADTTCFIDYTGTDDVVAVAIEINEAAAAGGIVSQRTLVGVGQ